MRVCFVMWVVCLVLGWMRAWGICGRVSNRGRSWLWGMRLVLLLGKGVGVGRGRGRKWLGMGQNGFKGKENSNV